MDWQVETYSDHVVHLCGTDQDGAGVIVKPGGVSVNVLVAGRPVDDGFLFDDVETAKASALNTLRKYGIGVAA